MEPLFGLLLVNKPSGPSSYDMIRWIKRSVKDVKIGHAGTLDPLASGLLIVLLGKATKQQDSFMKLEKTYLFSMRLGLKTDSGDITGKTIQESPIPPLENKIILEALSRFEGNQFQIPPMYSALKKEGTPLYKLARKGEVVERSPRPINIHEISFLGKNDVGDLQFRARCSSGTYIRTLAEDIGTALGTCATMTELVREKIGPYSLSQAVDGETLAGLSAAEIMRLTLVPELV